ncbi:Interactor protein for cytohesin exchange factors like, partial [Actinidia chinensis var. chinensis]
MVILDVGGDREAEKSMAMGTEGSKPLHNFTMPCLRWGNQRLLRCMKVNPAADRREDNSIGRRIQGFKKSPSPASTVFGGSGLRSEAWSDGDGGIEAVRAKLMVDLQAATDKMKVAILTEGLKESPPAPPAVANAEAARPWNLRTRRAACKAPDGGGGAKSSRIEERKSNFSPLRSATKSPRLCEERERAKFSISLSRREIEEDFWAMAGHRPHRRPKKRPKIVQKQLDSLFPGVWLTEVTADDYKVADSTDEK